MIKYNIVVCCYDKILVNMSAYVIAGQVSVVRCSGVILILHYLFVHMLRRPAAAALSV
jgi:hypothetical protein